MGFKASVHEIVHDKMGKWVTLVLLLVGAAGKWVTTEEILGRVHVGEFDVVHCEW